MDKEIWKPVKGYEQTHEVSNLGRVRSVVRVVEDIKGRKRVRGGKVLNVQDWKNKDSYTFVTLASFGNRKTHSVHRIVALAFLDNPLNLKEVNHKNGIKNDNRVTNLEWVTQKENVKHNIHELNNHSGLKLNKPRGVTFREKYNDWVAKIGYNDKYKHLGVYRYKDEAYKAYFEKFIELFGYEPWDLNDFPTHNNKTKITKRGKPRGVTYRSEDGVWTTQIVHNKKHYHLKVSKDKKECYKAFYDKYIELRGYAPWDLDEYPTH